jgi:hypothetical protein
MMLSFARPILAVALAAGAIAAFGLAMGEVRVVEIEAAAARGDLAPSDACAPECSERVRVALARITTDRALRTPSPDARNPDLDVVVAARPYWPKALVEHAYWLSVRQPNSPATIAAIADSYRAAPFSRDAALWRVAQVAAGWRAAPPALRAQALAEVEWYQGIDGPSRAAMSDIIAGSPVEVALMIRAAR